MDCKVNLFNEKKKKKMEERSKHLLLKGRGKLKYSLRVYIEISLPNRR